MATEVGVAYVNIIPKTDGFASEVAAASQDAGAKGAEGIGSSIKETLKSTFGDLLSTGGEMGSKISTGMEQFLSGAGRLAIVGAVAAIGVEALHQLESIGAEIDAMTDEIIVGTGASGEALEALKQNAMGVATEVPVGFAKSGDIIQDFNTRLGLSGKSLQDVSTRAAQLDHIVGGFNYDNMATMFNVWAIGADDMNEKMDYMFGVSQNTGIGFDSLTSIMKSAGPTLQNLGFSFEESANMAGLLDKAGIDASSTMSKMSKALVELSKPGESAQDAFRRVVGEMQGYIEAGDTASAMEIATKVFGTRGAAQFIGALQSGALNMDKLSDSALGATGSIEGTYEATKDWPEQWELIQTRVQAALEPLGSAVFSTLGGLLDGIGEGMTAVWQASEPLRNKIGELASGIGERLQPVLDRIGPFLQTLADGAVTALGFAFEVLATNIGYVADTVSWIWDNALAPFGSWLADTFGPAFDTVATTVGNLVALAPVIKLEFQKAADAVKSAWKPIGDFFDTIVRRLQTIFKPIADYLGIPFEIAEDSASSALEGIGKKSGDTADASGKSFANVDDVIGARFNEAKSIAATALSGISSSSATSYKSSTGAWTGWSNYMGGKFGDAKANASRQLNAISGDSSNAYRSSTNAWNGFSGSVGGKFEDARRNASSSLGGISSSSAVSARDSVPPWDGLGDRIRNAVGNVQYPQPHVWWDEHTIFGNVTFRMPHVSWYAAGGFVDGATLIGAGEAGAEMILPKSGGLMNDFASAVTEEVDMGEVVEEIRAFRREIGPIISEYAPYMTIRELTGRIGASVNRGLVGGVA
ncbi:MAG: phage tail tape measure protein [Eggerthellaceae bacterium]|nr:phage tail tape measure protein [Eggerthellaceae bacterium]